MELSEQLDAIFVAQVKKDGVVTEETSSLSNALLKVRAMEGVVEAAQEALWYVEGDTRKLLEQALAALEEQGLEASHDSARNHGAEETNVTPRPDPPQPDSDPSGAPGWPLPKAKEEQDDNTERD
jgi:hypothetical protein